MTVLDVPDDPKQLRETLCIAQSSLACRPTDGSILAEHMARLQRLIDECDRHRPLGPDGKHGTRHTPTCGCETPPPSNQEQVRKAARQLRATADRLERAAGLTT